MAVQSSQLHQSLAAQTAAAANISAQLNQSRQQAGLLSLSAKNLSVIAVRIGQEAAGLKVLSLFYDEFAQRAIKVSNEINQLAADIALNSVKRWRSEMFRLKMEQVLRHPPAFSGELLNHKMQLVAATSAHLKQNTDGACQALESHLEELLTFMQSMQVIAINARVEAGNLPLHKAQLDDLSAKIDITTQKILENVHACQHRMKEIKQP